MSRKKVDRVIEYLEEAIHSAERSAVTEEELSERWLALGRAQAFRLSRSMLMHHAAPDATKR
jgi:hypothetical protein